MRIKSLSVKNILCKKRDTYSNIWNFICKIDIY
jgi:hypothetical protein